MALRVCNTPGCPELIPPGQGRCDTHRRQADRRRGTPAERGYTSQGHLNFRRQVLARDPICVMCRATRATVADHHPRDRRELVRLGLNPNDPTYGRGLCHTCHSIATAQAQPGGWNEGV